MLHFTPSGPRRAELGCGLIAKRVHVGLGSDPCGEIRSRLGLSLNGYLDEDELRRFEWRNAYDEDYAPKIDVLLGHGGLITANKEGLLLG